MPMPTMTPTFLADVACAASSILAPATVAGERRTGNGRWNDSDLALVERSAT